MNSQIQLLKLLQMKQRQGEKVTVLYARPSQGSAMTLACEVAGTVLTSTKTLKSTVDFYS